MDQQLFYAFDGDNIGKRHARALLSDDVEDIRNISTQITEANKMVRDFVECNDGQMISFGGDEGIFSASANFVSLLEQLRQDYQNMVGATLSIGYGSAPSEAGKALLAAKSRGKDRVVQYDESVEQDVDDAIHNTGSDNQDERAKIAAVVDGDNQEPDSSNKEDQVLPEGSDSEENEPTLSEPPKQDNNHGYDSGYKNQDKEVRDESYQANDVTPPTVKKPNLIPHPKIEEGTCTDIQESNRLANEQMPDPKDEEPMDKKPAPKSYHGQTEGEAPESMAQPKEGTAGELKYSDGNTHEPQPDMPIENATSDVAEETEEQDMIGEGQHCPSCTCDQHGDSAEETLDQHLENAKDFEDSIDDGQPSNTDELLDAHLENAADLEDKMDENGVSRPEDYDEKQGDMGLSEEDAGDPNLSEVLQGGLDQHADSIQKEKVMQLVGQALDSFKAQKQILDKAKEQAPQLYDSCIQMLRAMIELCSLAGLDNSPEAEQEVNEIEGQSESPEEQPGAESVSEEEQPKEKCPNCGQSHEEKPAAPGGAAPFPKK